MRRDDRRLRRDTTGWLLFVLVWLSCAWFGSWEYNPNTASRLYAAISLAEDGDATIDEFAPLTIDKARFGDHFYTEKAPGMTLMAVPVVWTANAIFGDRSADYTPAYDNWPFNKYLKIRVRMTAVLVCALLTALASLLLYDLARRMTGSIGAAMFGALGFALGSTMWGWSTTAFGHAPVASLLVVAFWAVWRGTEPESRAHVVRYAALAGLALGWAVLVEHSAVVEGLPIALFALWRLRLLDPAVRLRAAVAAVAAGSVALVALLGYNMVAFGTPFRVSYSGVRDFAGMQQGLFGLTYPKPYVLFQITFGERRGLFWVAPVMVLAPLGLLRLYRLPQHRDTAIAAIAVAATAFLLNASYFYWDGGHATGPRHAVPALGFLGLGLAAYWQVERGRFTRTVAVLLLALSIGLNLAIASAEITAPDTIERSVWEGVFVARFLPGYLRTVPDEWLGFTPWQGLMLYGAVAGPLLALLVVRTVRGARA